MKLVGMMSLVISSVLVMGGCGSTYQYRAATPAGHNCQMHCSTQRRICDLKQRQTEAQNRESEGGAGLVEVVLSGFPTCTFDQNECLHSCQRFHGGLLLNDGEVVGRSTSRPQPAPVDPEFVSSLEAWVGLHVRITLRGGERREGTLLAIQQAPESQRIIAVLQTPSIRAIPLDLVQRIERVAPPVGDVGVEGAQRVLQAEEEVLRRAWGPGVGPSGAGVGRTLHPSGCESEALRAPGSRMIPGSKGLLSSLQTSVAADPGEREHPRL